MSQEHSHVVTKKVVLTAWELVVVKPVSVRPASVSLECWYLTERKHVAFLSSSSYLWKYSRNTTMMKLSVFTLRISSWQGRKISVSISCSKKTGFFINLFDINEIWYDPHTVSMNSTSRHIDSPYSKGKRMLAPLAFRQVKRS